jgi:Ca-activated chloride channel homolog
VKPYIRAITPFLAFSLILFLLSLPGQDKKAPDTPVFRAGVETVYLKVSVTDPLNRYVTGLEKEHFHIFEDKIEQSVIHFSQMSAPISVGLVFDVSNSMSDNNNIAKAKNAFKRFMEFGNKEDEYFLVTFNQNTKLVQPFTNDSGDLKSDVALLKSGGSTALYDAVYMGIDHVKRGKNEKKALILITDGEDNSSRYSYSEVCEFAKESDVQIYGIGEEGKLGYGRGAIQNIVSITGGRAFFPQSFSELDYYVDLIHSELRNQYILGYNPANKIHDGKYRKIKVKLSPPEGMPKLMIRARDGYYAPKS